MRYPYWHSRSFITIASLSLAALGIVTIGGIFVPGVRPSSPRNPDPTLPASVTGTPVIWSGIPTQGLSPTASPAETVTLSAPAGAATATPTLKCFAAEFIRDVTVPDGTTLRLGEEFNKTWRLKNSGSCSWDTRFHLVFIKGTPLSSQTTISLGGPIRPGDTVDLTVPMAAPDKAGSYTGYWMLRTPDEEYFGVGKSAIGMFWVTVNVSKSGEPEPTDPNSDSGEAVDASRRFIANQLGIDPNQLVVLDVENGRWFDTCLGINLDDDYDCEPVPEGILGYRIQLKWNNHTYEVHTTLNGSYVFWSTV